ncbi:MspA family porin [Rhodococcus sp. WAY2]|uniref:MspA family porin n=1 Tax=Rhodococcus sp. WAY2 TaxID=2663121 RepID=UPI0013201E0A|nr:MspA family porin [Rhodococcus sp. WAY2]QHE66990.1 putative porin protein [Rhodococcus sp. WAY2]
MTDITTSRYGYKRFTRAVAVAGIAVLGMVMGNGTASAGVDNSSSVVDAGGNRIEVLQGDTSYHTVPPLDGVPTSVEFFHDGYAAVNITGPNAAEFEDTQLTLGYQIGYPVALAGATIVLNTPNLDWFIESNNGIDLSIPLDGTLPDELGLNAGTAAGIGGSIIPSQELDIDLEPGGITTVPFLEGQEFDGPSALVRMQGMHGFISGAIGPVTIRPYAMAVTANGDSVMTYGVPQKLN